MKKIYVLLLSCLIVVGVAFIDRDKDIIPAQSTSKKIILENPYKYTGKYRLKGQLHCHTTYSDGLRSPREVVEAYKKAGFDFITITDHDALAPEIKVEGITWIGQGVEELRGNGHPHILSINVKDQSYSTNVFNILNYHNNNHDFTGFAHPNDIPYSTPTETLIREKYNFIEVYNAYGNYEPENKFRKYAEDKWDIVLSLGKKVYGIATDDLHQICDQQLNAAWVVVCAEKNTKEDILNSLRKGCFYASNGNNLEIKVEGNMFHSHSDFNSSFLFIGNNGKVFKEVSNAKSADYNIKGDEKYIRVKAVRTSDGKEAWSQPIFIRN